jgi:hypothetical protein
MSAGTKAEYIKLKLICLKMLRIYMRLISLILLILLTAPLQSPYSQSAGTTSFEFLRSQYSPRGAAMGGNLMAIKNDIQAIFYNPASLSGHPDRTWTINYVNHLIDFQAGNIAYAQPVKKLGNLSAGLLYFNYGDFNETDEFGEPTGRTFGASEFSFILGLSNPLGSGFDYGIDLKYIYSSLDNFSASAIALDAGIIYTVPSIDDFTLGVSLLNLGTTLDNYTDHQEKLPLILHLGFAKKLEHLPLLLTAGFQDLTASESEFTDRFKRFALGGEFDVSEIIKFRLGYQNEINQAVKPLGRTILSGFSLGLGIYWRNFRIDYAYSNYGDLGNQNRIGITGSL